MKVHVVAWWFNSGGGFDWYFEEAAANVAFAKEQENEKDPVLAKEGWKAHRFTHETQLTDSDEITREIDEVLSEHEARAGRI
jgi:very-short-patch-repair endonuclease